MCDLLFSCDWSPCDAAVDFNLDQAVACLGNNIMAAVDTLAPQKIFKVRRRRPPWVGAELAQLLRKRDALYRRQQRTKDVTIYKEYDCIRKRVDELTDRARLEYYRCRLSDALENNTVWRELRSLGLLAEQKDELVGFPIEELNRHFASVSVAPFDDCCECDKVIEQSSNEGFAFKAISLDDVILAISHFSSQAQGADGIPQSVVVKSLPAIGNLLVKLYNSSFAEGAFPALWRRAHVLPLKKCKMPSSPTDFRPIALLCFLSKVLEKLAHDQLREYLTACSILDPMQTGFRPYHSTETALLKLTEDIRQGIDRKYLTLLLLFDFSKAFDTVLPSRLLDQLHGMGLSRAALLWINSYLKNRQQRIFMSHEKSQWIETNLGVPQGSVLGPLLFCLYINNLRHALQPLGVQHILYADDLQIYVQVPYSGLDEGVALLRQAAIAVSGWARGASLRLNANKTKAIIFGCRKFIADIRSGGCLGIDLGDGVLVPFSETVVSLGVVLDSTLTWRSHVDHITKKINKVLYSLRFFYKYTTEVLRKRLAEALLFPHLDYCSLVMLDASLEIRTRLQTLQNSCIRYVKGLRRDDHVSPHRVSLGWLRTDSRRHYYLAVLMYKIVRMRIPDYLECLFSKYVPRGSVTRGTKELQPPPMRTETGKRSFRVQGAHFWNSLPVEIRNLPSLGRFKSALRRRLLELD